ncbi:amidase [Saccharopolyspora sp. K220]|uniref:amidase n=1 Tax=Saccharopolyspora soli TaxID=2926618 RepID=UPI001F5783E5|nr:amidase [Saccharopolyspora soli]MCI2416462.1 amidase [Saccharopolyspora soli]
MDLAAVLDGPAWAMRRRLVEREFSVVEVVRATLDRIAERDRVVHSFLTIDTEGALARAEELDEKLARGDLLGPLFGIPVSLKDLFETAGLRTTSGSRALADYVPDWDSVHAQRLREADAVIVGKTNTPEFAVFTRTTNDLMPETVNPWDHGRSPGGSSGGAAASVAAGLTQIAIGSDGGGSTRIPAALCGLFGLQPSQGLVPHVGGLVGTLLFSSAGPITRDVRDAALTLQVLAGPDARDPMSLRDAPGDYLSNLDDQVGDLRFAWLERSGLIDASAEVAQQCRDAARELVALGATVRAASGSMQADRWRDGFYQMMMSDRYASGGARFYEDVDTRALLTDYARTHFERAAKITGAQYSHALEERFHAIRALEALFEGADLLLTPTVGMVAPELAADRNRIPDEARLPYVAYTYLINYTGFTAATVPCGTVAGLPVGLQVIGRPGSEATVLRACRTLERVLPPIVPAAAM